MPNRNYYENNPDHPWAPARKALALVPDDDTDVTELTSKGLLVVGAGSLTIHAADSAQALAAFDVAAGQVIPICCQRIMAATDAVVIGLA